MIAFLGNSDFGTELLQDFIDRGFKISYVTTKKVDKPHAQGSLLEFERICSDNSIPLYKNANINEQKFIDMNKDMGVKYGIIGGYDGIIKRGYLDSVDAVINTHFGIIPRNRGCNPSIWDILSGNEGGYTTYKISDEIDEGDIILQNTVPIDDNETSESLYNKVKDLSISEYGKVFDSLNSGEIKTVEYSEMDNIYHNSNMPNDRFVSWDWKAELIFRMHRSLKFGSYPTIRTMTSSGEPLELNPLRFGNDYIGEPATVIDIDKDTSRIFCSDGYIDVDRINKNSELVSISTGCYSIDLDYGGKTIEDSYFQTRV